ncbi:MAG: electron transfer flavoprotein subunit beta, partial [Pyramidobacter sp.]|nr:electron transfer flavoprotein subunit beta [Pyramidobacter sp.]
AKTVEIPILTAADIGVPEEELGLKGSATQVIKINYPKMTRQGVRIIAAGRADDAAAEIIAFCEKKNCIGGER